MAKPLILVDGSSYFFRAFHALPPLTNSKGQPTGAIYGVSNMIKRLIKDYDPELMAVVFDAKGKTFRDDWYPEYKANRAATPPDLLSQFEPLIKVLKAMGLPLLIIEGVEADDVIGTLAHQASEKGMDVIISTGDKDMAQLVNEKVTLINTMSNQTLNIESVQTKFGVFPHQIIDYLTLVGDSVDNVPGITKCGPKTAAKWLQDFNTLDNLVANAESIKGKIGENLREGLSFLPLAKKLVTIKKDVEIPHQIEELILQTPDENCLVELTKDLEFKAWLNELLAQSHLTLDETKKQFTVVREQSEFDALLEQLTNIDQFALDTETTNIDAIQAEIVGISIAFDKDNPFYIPLIHQDNSKQLDREAVLALLKPILENPKIAKIGQNLKYDYNVFKNHDIHLQGIVFDTMLESYVLNSAANRHDLETLALKYLGYKAISFNDIAGSGSKQLRFDEIPVDKAAPYAAEDADLALKLHHHLYPLLAPSLKTVLDEIEIPLIPVLADMEYKGVLIDIPTLEKHGSRLKERMIILEQEATALAGKVFNLNSPKQLQEILFDEQKLPVLTKTPKGQASTAEAVLQELAFDYRLPAVILEYRSLAKLVSTYIDALPKRVNAKTGRVHTSFNQAVAATGRLSSSEPNLQNIPIRNEEGRLIRKAFIADKENYLVAADYSQIELRIMAHLSEDKNLLSAFSQGLDIHTATASQIFQVAIDEVSFEQRRRAKAINFGLIYGMSSFGLARQLGIERQDAQFYMDSYFKQYPGVLAYMENTRQLAHRQGYVETLFGRRLYLPEINAQKIQRQKAAERMAINAPMQGTAADIIKKAMLDLAAWQQQEQIIKAPMILQVHDELVFEVAKVHVDSAVEKIRSLMENCVSLAVPLVVSVGVGSNWDEAH